MPWFVVLANFYGVKIPTMAYFCLSMCYPECGIGKRCTGLALMKAHYYYSLLGRSDQMISYFSLGLNSGELGSLAV